MSLAGNLRRGFEEGINQRNLAVFNELLDDRYVNHSFPGDGSGPENFKQVMQMFVAGFPDMQVTIHDVIEDGDRAASHGSWTGTHQGEFMGVPPTGRSVTVSFIDFWRAEDGKFVENWVQMDILGLMQQLGVAPAPGSASV